MREGSIIPLDFMVKRKGRERKGPRNKDNTDGQEHGDLLPSAKIGLSVSTASHSSCPLGTEWSMRESAEAISYSEQTGTGR